MIKSFFSENETKNGRFTIVFYNRRKINRNTNSGVFVYKYGICYGIYYIIKDEIVLMASTSYYKPPTFSARLRKFKKELSRCRQLKYYNPYIFAT